MLKLVSFFYIIISKLFSITIGKNVTIWPGCVIKKGFGNGKDGDIVIGDFCELSSGVILKAYGGRIILGKNTFVGEYACIYGHGGVEIGNNTLIAMHCCIISANHAIPDKKTLIRSQADILLPVRIGNDVWIGAGAKIMGGTTIGNGCVIGAGAVVTDNLLPFSIALGIPAKVIKFRND